MRRRILKKIAASAWLALALPAGCGDDDPPPACFEGTCVCRAGERCSLPCAAPPCHLACAGDNASCRGECGNAECYCGPRSLCEFGCQSPPCHVNCDSTSECTGVCANGNCNCESGSACVFTCMAPPCHVACAGTNRACDGECANGSCNCGPDSECHFSCLDGNCTASCASGSSCTLNCVNGRAGEQGCRFESCAAGAPVVCPGGSVTVCGSECPPG